MAVEYLHMTWQIYCRVEPNYTIIMVAMKLRELTRER